MKFEVYLNDHEIVTGRSYDDIVNALAKLQWPDENGKQLSAEEYMKEAAIRVWSQKQCAVRACCSQHFVEDMELAKAIKEVE